MGRLAALGDCGFPAGAFQALSLQHTAQLLSPNLPSLQPTRVPGGRLVTLFSAPHYPQFIPEDEERVPNKGAVAVLRHPHYHEPTFVQFDAVLPRPEVRGAGGGYPCWGSWLGAPSPCTNRLVRPSAWVDARLVAVVSHSFLAAGYPSPCIQVTARTLPHSMPCCSQASCFYDLHIWVSDSEEEEMTEAGQAAAGASGSAASSGQQPASPQHVPDQALLLELQNRAFTPGPAALAGSCEGPSRPADGAAPHKAEVPAVVVAPSAEQATAAGAGSMGGGDGGLAAEAPHHHHSHHEARTVHPHPHQQGKAGHKRGADELPATAGEGEGREQQHPAKSAHVAN